MKYKNYILKVGQQGSSSSRIKYGEKPQVGGLNKVPSSPDPIHNSKTDTVDDENKSQIGRLRKVPSSPYRYMIVTLTLLGLKTSHKSGSHGFIKL